MKVTAWGMGAAVWLAATATGVLARPSEPLAPHVPGQVILKLATSDPADHLTVSQRIRLAIGKSIAIQQVEALQANPLLQKVTLSSARDLPHALRRLNAASGIEYAEPNYLYSVAGERAPRGMPNDARAGELWALKNIGQADHGGQPGTANADINVLPVWEMGIRGDRRITVAVIDTGVDWDHPDLAANLYTNPGEIPGNGIDDDQNGYVDDIHGWNFVNQQPDSRDDHDHGTHCAGTIGAVGDNGQGIVGVNWQVSLMPLKFIGVSGTGTLEAATEAIYYAIRMRAQVLNNSWGGVGMSVTLRDAIVQARDAGILFIAAAGNTASDNDRQPTYPANYDVENVISVAASDNRDSLSDNSSFGKRTVHLAAPGNWILSTVRNGGYALMRGTSMAAPHVAGVAALLASAHPEWTYREIKDRLIRSSDKVRSLRRKVKAGGRINAHHALVGIYPPLNEPDETAWRDVSVNIESLHPYAPNEDLTIPLEVPGAKFVRVIFDRVELEPRYDRLWLEDAVTGEKVTEISGRANALTSEYVEGSMARLRFVSDYSVVEWGYRITRLQAIY